MSSSFMQGCIILSFNLHSIGSTFNLPQISSTFASTNWLDLQPMLTRHDRQSNQLPRSGDFDATNPKSILKSKDNSGRPQKRVRFNLKCDDKDNYDDDGHEEARDVRMKTSSLGGSASDQLSKSQEFNLAVPDYIRNPSRYTRYTFDDSPSEMDDKSNKETYMTFLSQLNKELHLKRMIF
ncbi:hypothetical protein LR48_Vigan10g176700 [Vigna angularis]|uniref:U5 small nuclear ribonucleoprotein TSSC4 n=1 Tax=Phaseolus angularis TaxID=3914 RepID=A0A0L9VLF3_PHAAN|nr:hypothetical protein LR48_Vigan10g176700 [Vigna angularis]